MESPLSQEMWQRKHLVFCLFTHTPALLKLPANLPNASLSSQQQYFARNDILALLKQIFKNSVFPTFLSKSDLLLHLHTQSLMLIFFCTAEILVFTQLT